MPVSKLCPSLNRFSGNSQLLNDIAWRPTGKAIPGQALRVPGGWGSRISEQSAHEGAKIGRLYSPPPRKYSWYSFLLRVWVDPRATARPEGLRQRKISMPMTIGNWTRDLPACSAASQPTALPRAADTTAQTFDDKILSLRNRMLNPSVFPELLNFTTCLFGPTVMLTVT
jgi:hypothetical protein